MIAHDLTDFEGWLRCHSAALAAWCVSALPASDVRRELAALWLDQAFAAGVKTLSTAAEAFPEDESDLGDGYALWALPEYPLRMLAHLSTCIEALPRDIEQLPAIAARLWEVRMRPRRAGGQVWPSRARATNVISSAILDGLAAAEGILNLARRILHRDWRGASTSDSVLTAFQSALPTLRRMPGEPAGKLQALISIRNALRALPNDVVEGDRSLGWSGIEFNIVNSLFSWPLLVARSGPASAIGLSIPILIDVRTDDHSATKVRILQEPNSRIRTDWLPSIENAHSAAMALWLKETGFFGIAWRDRVSKRSQTLFDLSAADMLLHTVGEVEWDNSRFEFDMEGRSLELPAALAIFSQLRGLRAPFAAGSTGMLADAYAGSGAQLSEHEEIIDLENPPTRTEFDRELELPGGLVEKLGWADAAGIFDKLIFPQIKSLASSGPGHGERQQEEVRGLQRYLVENSSPHRPHINFCKRLSNAADAAFRGQWRRSQFIRCVELSTLLRGERVVGFRERAKHLVEIFSSSTSALVVLPYDISFADVCGSLAWLNLYGRDHYEVDLGIPPMLSVAFVRLVADEGGDRLCAVLCESARAPVECIHHVCSAASNAERGRRLADVLNKRLENHRHPGWRAPDLIVCGVPEEALSDLRATTVGGRSVWRENLTPLVNSAFAGRLQRIADERWGEALGTVRIVFALDRDFEPANVVGSVDRDLRTDHPGESDIPAEMLLGRLRVFRSEFTQQEAALLLGELGLQGVPVRQALQDLERNGFLRYAHGSWTLTKSGRDKRVSEPENGLEPAQLHAAAAVARAPYLSSERLPGLPDFEARRADRVHEAQFHVAKALTGDISHDLRGWLQAANARLVLHFDVPGWGAIFRAASDGSLTRERPWANAIIALGEQLLATALRESEDIEPDRIIALFRVIEQRKRQVEGSYPTSVAAQQDGEWRDLTERSLRVIETYAGIARHKPGWGLPRLDEVAKETDEIASAIALVTLLLVGRYRLTSQERSSLSAWLTQALPLVPAELLNIPPTWFEQQGDAVKSHIGAREWYQRGYLAVPGYVGNWIKALGCLAEDDEESIDEIIAGLKALAKQNPGQWRKMEAFAKGHRKRELAMNTRWRTGFQYAVERGLLV
jgi:hypothetical protein